MNNVCVRISAADSEHFLHLSPLTSPPFPQNAHIPVSREEERWMDREGVDVKKHNSNPKIERTGSGQGP